MAVYLTGWWAASRITQRGISGTDLDAIGLPAPDTGTGPSGTGTELVFPDGVSAAIAQGRGSGSATAVMMLRGSDTAIGHGLAWPVGGTETTGSGTGIGRSTATAVVGTTGVDEAAGSGGIVLGGSTLSESGEDTGTGLGGARLVLSGITGSDTGVGRGAATGGTIHSPVTTEFGSPGAAQRYVIPDWADALDIVAIGGGGGGQGGGSLQSNGEAGKPGSWGGKTIAVSTLTTTALYVTVGTGGDAGHGPAKGVGTDGHATTVSDGTSTLLTVAGGLHGASGVAGGISDSTAVPPYTFRDITYPGTPGGITHDPPPAPAGHGVGGTGGDGNVVGGGNGGAGGPGKVWIRAYQLMPHSTQPPPNTLPPGQPTFDPTLGG